MKPRFALSILAVGWGIATLNAGTVWGQTFPSKPIRLMTGSAGGNSDWAARLIAQGIAGPLGQPVIVENRGGGGTTGPLLKNAPPDGHTLLFTAGTLWMGPMLAKMDYDPVKDIAPITWIARAPSVLVVHPSVPVKSVKELLALAKARPGELNYSSGALGASDHLTGELFKRMAGVNIVHVPYKASTIETNDLLGGYVQLKFGTAGEVATHIKSGKLRALAVTSPQPSALTPGLPTVASQGVPGFESETIWGIYAPAKTPKAVIDRLSQEIARFVRLPETKEKFVNVGADTVGSTPEALAAVIDAEIARWGKLVKDLGIKAE